MKLNSFVFFRFTDNQDSDFKRKPERTAKNMTRGHLKIFKPILPAIAVLIMTVLTLAQETSQKIDLNSRKWSNTQGALIVSSDEKILYDGKPSMRIEHTSDLDWTVFNDEIPVKAGEIYELSYYIKKNDSAPVNMSVAVRNGKEVIDWIYGEAHQNSPTDWKKVSNKFVVSEEMSSIQARLVGSGKGICWIAGAEMKKAGTLNLESNKNIYKLENDFLKVSFLAADGSFSVLDKRTGRLWEQKTGVSFCGSVKKSDRSITFSLIGFRSYSEYEVTLELERDLPELIVTIDKKDKQAPMAELQYPLPFFSKLGDRLVIPMNEGISYPVEEEKTGLGSLIFYGGHGLCMSFYSVMEDKTGPIGGAGYMGLVETGDDASASFPRYKNGQGKELMTAAVNWIGQKKVFGYKRSLRLIFFDKGSHVAVCKRYREYAKKIGKYLPFTEKIKKNPNLKDGIDRLVGAANIWYFGGDHSRQIDTMRSLGMKNMLWSSSSTAEIIDKVNKLPGMLSSRYDIYQDVTDPSRLAEVGGGWTDPFPKDINWTSPAGDWRKGWGVRPKGDVKKEKPFIYCAVICDKKALPYADKRIGNELKVKHYKARFIDTTVAAPWFECWHPDHPMTRTDSRIWKMKLLALLGERFNLVCGSETGHDASVPYCDFYEGMMSLGMYRVPDSGRDLVDIWNDPPERVRRFQLGEKFRLPLWELVYHDCTVSYWYWGDYNNKLPSLWDKRDLFNALYGVPPMYLFVHDFWVKNKDRFIKSYQVAQPVSRLTGYAQMLDHQILTKDRSVQKTIFSNGVEVTVNFGDQSFKCSDGFVLEAGKSRIVK